MKSDIQIAKEAKLIKAKDVGEKIGITRTEIQSFGRHMAKVPISLIDQKRVDQSNLILVTAIKLQCLLVWLWVSTKLERMLSLHCVNHLWVRFLE